MNLKALQVFRQIVLTGTLADAAVQLNVSRSAASRLLSNLESDLGLELFSRQRRSLVLTREGDLLYRHLSQTLDGLDQIPALAADIRARPRERLSIVTAVPLAMTLVSPAIARMGRGGNVVDAALNIEIRFDIESRVAARGYNLGLISLPVENAILDLSLEPFLRCGVEVLLRRDHPLAAREALSVADIAGERFVTLLPRQRWRDRLGEIMGVAGHQPDIAVETGSTLVVLQMVRDGLGIGLADRATLALTPDDDAVMRPLKDAKAVTYAAIHPQGARAPLAASFLDAVGEVVEARRSADPETAAAMELI